MFLRSAIITILILLAGYGLFEAWPLISGPQLSVASPVSGESIPDGIVNVSGTAKRVVSLTVNGMTLLPDEETGSFSEVLVLPRGGAILTFVATDRFGRTVYKQEPVYVP